MLYSNRQKSQKTNDKSNPGAILAPGVQESPGLLFSVLDGFVVLLTRMNKTDTFRLAYKFNVSLYVFS